MKSYIIYYTSAEGTAEAVEETGVKDMRQTIGWIKRDGGTDIEVYRINNENDRDDVTLMNYR